MVPTRDQGLSELRNDPAVRDRVPVFEPSNAELGPDPVKILAAVFFSFPDSGVVIFRYSDLIPKEIFESFLLLVISSRGFRRGMKSKSKNRKIVKICFR